MEYSVQITCNDTYIYFNFSGKLHIEQVLGLTRYLYSDPNYRELKKVIMNFNDTEVMEGGKDVMKFAMKMMAERPFEDKTQICAVTEDMRLTTLLETFRMITEQQPYEFEIKENEQLAKEWLNV